MKKKNYYHRSEKIYRSLAENFPNGALFLFNNQYEYLAVGGKGLSAVGLNSDLIIGRKVQEVFPELWETIKPHCDNALNGSESYYEVTFSGRIYSNQALPILLDLENDSENLGIVVTQDITDKKIFEENLRISNEFFEQAFNDAAFGICFVGLDGIFQKINNSILEIFGFTEHELLGKGFQDITHPDDKNTGKKYFKELLNGDISKAIFKKRYLHKNGTTVYASVATSLIRDKHNTPLHFITQISKLDKTEYSQ